MMVESWCLEAPVVPLENVSRSGGRFFLGAALHVRLYAGDPSGLTLTDLAHWLTYHRYAGVDRVWVYDAYVDPTEKFGDAPALKGAMDSGFLEYVDWGRVARGNVRDDGSLKAKHIVAVQIPAFEDAQRRANTVVKWLALTDMDEYLSVPADVDARFLARFVRDTSRATKRGKPIRVSQLLFPNVIAEGPRDVSRGPMLIQQVSRLRDDAHNKSEALTKQIVRVDAARAHNLHRSDVAYGETLRVSRSTARVEHFHAGRTVGFLSWQDLEPKTLAALLERTRRLDPKPFCDQILACFPPPPRLRTPSNEPEPPPPSPLLVVVVLFIAFKTLKTLLAKRAAVKKPPKARPRWR